MLETYKALVEMSPEGIHHWKNGRDFYASDVVPLTFWASYLLDDIAGTRDNVPIMVDDNPQSLALAQDTNVIVGMAGPSNPDGGTWVEVHNFGVTVDANTDEAAIKLLSNLTDIPLPKSPIWIMLSPNILRSGITFCTSSLFPPTINVNVPSLALIIEPDIGVSINIKLFGNLFFKFNM